MGAKYEFAVFRCMGCTTQIKKHGPDLQNPGRGLADRVRITGRKRRPNKQELARRSARRTNPSMDVVTRQYVCRDCGYSGWSRHNELRDKESRSKLRNPEGYLMGERNGTMKAPTRVGKWTEEMDEKLINTVNGLKDLGVKETLEAQGCPNPETLFWERVTGQFVFEHPSMTASSVTNRYRRLMQKKAEAESAVVQVEGAGPSSDEDNSVVIDTLRELVSTYRDLIGVVKEIRDDQRAMLKKITIFYDARTESPTEEVEAEDGEDN